MILYFRKGVRVTELLLAKDTLRPGMRHETYDEFGQLVKNAITSNVVAESELEL